MTIFDQIEALAKKIALSISKGEKPVDLEESDIFSEDKKKYLLKNITEESKIKERSQFFDKVEKGKRKDLELFKRRIGRSTKTSYWHYAAAASVVIAISLTFLFSKGDMAQSNTHIATDHNIRIGTDKATLTLQDGSNIPLEKGQSYLAKNVSSNGEKLIYNANRDKISVIAYNYLTVPRGGQYQVKLSDGTQVWLNSESKLKYPVAFVAGETRRVDLVYGEAYFDVSPSTEHNGAKFKVFNQSQEIEVLGTEFNIKAYRDEPNIYTTLVEGKVAITTAMTNDELRPNQQAKLNLKNNSVDIAVVDVQIETSWKRGRFRFKEKSLKDIMTVLSRWYDMDVVFERKELEGVPFTGALNKRQNIEDILETITNTKFINGYEINDKKIKIK